MAGLIRVVWTALVLICSVQCNTEKAISSINGVKEEILRVEQRMMNHIDLIKISLETELKQQMNQQRKANEEFIKDDSFEDVLRTEVVAEIKQLKRGQKKMNRQLRLLLKSLTGIQQDKDWELCKDRKQTAKTHGDKLNATTLTVPIHKETAILATAVTPSLVTALPTTQARSLDTMLSPYEMKSRIIVAPIFAEIKHQFLEVNMSNNTIKTYPFRSIDRVLAVSYASKLRKLLIAKYNPKKIIASPLDTDQEEILLKGVECRGMAVDEDRQIIFLTTADPGYSISRMTTEGENFTLIVNLTGYGYYPRAIAVDPRERKIYSCNFKKVFTVRYDGQGLQTLATGSDMNVITLDNTGSILYYNHDYVLKKMSLSENVTSSVATLSKIPWTSRYYRDTIYSSTSYDKRDPDGGDIIEVDLRGEEIPRTLHSIKMEDSDFWAICLVH